MRKDETYRRKGKIAAAVDPVIIPLILPPSTYHSALDILFQTQTRRTRLPARMIIILLYLSRLRNKGDQSSTQKDRRT